MSIQNSKVWCTRIFQLVFGFGDIIVLVYRIYVTLFDCLYLPIHLTAPPAPLRMRATQMLSFTCKFVFQPCAYICSDVLERTFVQVFVPRSSTCTHCPCQSQSLWVVRAQRQLLQVEVGQHVSNWYSSVRDFKHNARFSSILKQPKAVLGCF